jgi:hypothetical protein
MGKRKTKFLTMSYEPSAMSHPLINGLIIMTASPYQNLSFPGLTGESRKELDARFRPAGMTGKPQW